MGETSGVASAMQPITITRTFDAPRELVFRAWTDPEHVAAWFGPEGFDTLRESVTIDLRAGGAYELVMVQRGTGREHRIRYEIVELVEPELLVLRSEPMPGMVVVARVELHDERGRTRLTLTDGPYPEDVGRGAGAGWQGAFDKLAGRLADAL